MLFSNLAVGNKRVLTHWLANCMWQTTTRPKSQINRLQHIQNSLARTVANTPKYSHITPVLASLHWLNLSAIDFSYLQSSHHQSTYQPTYLQNLISLQTDNYTRSSDVVTLARPSAASSLEITDRSFQYASPHFWNKLPFSLHEPVSLLYAYLNPSFSSPLSPSSPIYSFTPNSKLASLVNSFRHRSLIIDTRDWLPRLMRPTLIGFVHGFSCARLN